MSEPGFPDEPKPKWADLWGIDPDFTEGRSIDEFLNPTSKALLDEAYQRGLAEAKDLAEVAGRFGYELGRKEALKEVADEIALESENPKYVVVQMDKNTYLMLMNARYASQQPQEAPSEPLAASTGHSDLPEGYQGPWIPAVTREALLQAIAEAIDDLDGVPAMGTSAQHLEARAMHVVDAIAALTQETP